MKSAVWMVAAAALLAACGGSSSSGNTCNNTCATTGATQCSGDNQQTCVADAKGCLAWSAGSTCAVGSTCRGTACTDVCMLATVQTACVGAEVAFFQACAGGNVSYASSLDFCHYATSGATTETQALADCSAGAAANPATYHDVYKAAGQCCCPSGESCDYQDTTGWACIKSCTANADCTTAGQTACVPSFDPTKDAIVRAPHVCKPDDGAPYHGCNGALVTCSGATNFCYADSIGYFCTHQCTTDTQCGNPGNACCQALTSGGSGTGNACGVCP